MTALALLGTATLFASADAQHFPSRTVTLVVPLAPGGSTEDTGLGAAVQGWAGSGTEVQGIKPNPAAKALGLRP